jgi:hypothetical protein
MIIRKVPDGGSLLISSARETSHEGAVVARPPWH